MPVFTSFVSAASRGPYTSQVSSIWLRTKAPPAGCERPAQIAQFRASLVDARNRRTDVEGGRPLSDKYINNILVVLSKALKYAEDVELIARVPRVGIFRTERPEIVCWDVEQYARAARDHPTLPSSLSPSSFDASTANSIGSCVKTSFTKPLMIIDTAASPSTPRL